MARDPAEKAWQLKSHTEQAHIITMCYRSALFLKERVERDGWEWSWNYLREHTRCAFHFSFSNTISPKLYEVMRERYPDLARFQYAGEDDLFALPPKPPAPPPPTNARTDEQRRLIHNECAVCGVDAPFGRDVAVKDGALGVWYCKDHWTPSQ